MEEREQQIAALLLNKRAVIIKLTEPFVYTSGIKSPIYCDNRLLLSFPEARDEIIDEMLQIIEQKIQSVDCIAGVATAGIPWASIIADRLEKPLIYVRDKPKEHGKRNQIEGKIEKGQKVVVIEDLISTGRSSIKAIEAVRDAGGNVNYCIAVFTYEMKNAEEAFANAQCALHCTTKFSILVRQATALHKITKEQETIVLEWNQDPENWWKKYGYK